MKELTLTEASKYIGELEARILMAENIIIEPILGDITTANRIALDKLDKISKILNGE